MTLFAYLLFGYLSGSILYIHLYSALFAKKDATLGTEDGNPGPSTPLKKAGSGAVCSFCSAIWAKPSFRFICTPARQNAP